MSDTPKTDAAQAQNIHDAFGEKGYQSPWEFARQLERQLAEADSQINIHVDLNHSQAKCIADLHRQLPPPCCAEFVDCTQSNCVPRLLYIIERRDDRISELESQVAECHKAINQHNEWVNSWIHFAAPSTPKQEGK